MLSGQQNRLEDGEDTDAGPSPRVSDTASLGRAQNLQGDSSQMLVLLREHHFPTASTVRNELTSLLHLE